MDNKNIYTADNIEEFDRKNNTIKIDDSIYKNVNIHKSDDIKKFKKLHKEDKSRFVRTCATMSPELRSQVILYIARLSLKGVKEDFSSIVRKALNEYLKNK